MEYYYKYVVKSAVSKGIIPVCWDVPMGLFDRSTGAILDHGIINVILQGANEAEDVTKSSTH